MHPAVRNLEKSGFAVIQGLFSETDLVQFDKISVVIEESGSGRGGGRNVLKGHPTLLGILRSQSMLSLLEPILGQRVGVSEGIYLNKKDEANWLVAWHQDLFVTMKEKVPSDGYFSWTLKEGVPYVQPPSDVLEQSIWVRLNLDDNDKENGCLRVVPGSHGFGKIPTDQIGAMVEKYGDLAIPCNRGDVVLFRPLLLHASSKSSRPTQRRVIQVLFSGFQFENGLRWPF